MKLLIGLAACLALMLGSPNAAIAAYIYNANSDFTSFESSQSGNQDPFFSNFSAGYGQNLGDFTAFAPTQHTDNWHNNSDLQGWCFANSIAGRSRSGGLSPLQPAGVSPRKRRSEHHP